MIKILITSTFIILSFKLKATEAFLGIPYAEPTSIEAKKLASACAQIGNMFANIPLIFGDPEIVLLEKDLFYFGFMEAKTRKALLMIQSFEIVRKREFYSHFRTNVYLRSACPPFRES